MKPVYWSIFSTLILLFSLSATSIASTDGPSTTDPHAHHKMMMQNQTRYQKTYSLFELPAHTFKDQHGNSHNIHDFLHADRPIIISFIFTSCTTICPVLTATLSSAQKELMNSDIKPMIISISIDPEEDTPERLATYAKEFNAAKNWIFLTGELAKIVEVQRALDSYRGSKLNHEPVTILKAPGKKWLSLKGFTSAKDLVNEYRSYIKND